MAKYLAIAKILLIEFRAVKVEQVRRDLNARTDTLEGLASIFRGKTKQTITVDIILAPSHEVS